MAILQPTTTGGKRIAANYKATEINVDLDAFSPTDKMEWHRKTYEIIFRYVLRSTMHVNKLQNTVNKIERQLKHEKVVTKAKQLRISELEQKVVELGVDPSNPTPVQSLLKDNNN